jgi:hypothetical protein
MATGPTLVSEKLDQPAEIPRDVHPEADQQLTNADESALA